MKRNTHLIIDNRIVIDTLNGLSVRNGVSVQNGLSAKDGKAVEADSGVEICGGCVDKGVSLALPYADGGIQAGFPSPAQDYMQESIDLNRDLIRHPACTFFGRVSGDSMSGEGIADGDLLVIDKSLEPEEGDLAVCCVDGDFTLKRLHFCNDGTLALMPSNPAYSPIIITPDNDFTVWGIVTYTIKPNRRPRRP